MKKRIASLILSLLLLLSLLSLSVFGGDDPAASISGQEYDTLADAVAAANAGDEILLLKDCTGTGFVIDKPLTIDFNEKTYTVAPPVIGGSEYTQNQAFHIQYANDSGYTDGVVFKDGTIAIAPENATWDDRPVTRVIQNYVDLTMENMTITDENVRLRKDGAHPAGESEDIAKDTLVECDGGNSLFKNCTITASDENRFALAVDDWQAMCVDGTHLTIDGGKITGKLRFYSEGDPEELKSTLTFENYTAEVFDDHLTDDAGAVEQEKVEFKENGENQYKLVEQETGSSDEHTYFVLGKDIFFRVGKNYYKTLAEALAAAEGSDNKTLTLLDDLDLTEEDIKLSEGVILDLGGKTLICNSIDAEYGMVTDSADGKGKLIVSKEDTRYNAVFGQDEGDTLPLVDKEADGYRFFKSFIKRTTPTVSGDILSCSFRFEFTNPAAYALLSEDSVTLYFDIVTDKMNCYRFNDSTVARYR